MKRMVTMANLGGANPPDQTGQTSQAPAPNTNQSSHVDSSQSEILAGRTSQAGTKKANAKKAGQRSAQNTGQTSQAGLLDPSLDTGASIDKYASTEFDMLALSGHNYLLRWLTTLLTGFDPFSNYGLLL